MTIFALIYIGVEVTLGGEHLNPFLLSFPHRPGFAQAGSSPSSFTNDTVVSTPDTSPPGSGVVRYSWANSLLLQTPFPGLTLGRVALIWLNKLVGEYRVIFVYCLFAIG
jgi:hypothetical protein